MDKQEQWHSSIRIDIKAFLNKESPLPTTYREDELVHVWTIRLNAASCHSDEPMVYMYPPLKSDAISKARESDPNNPFHQHYRHFCQRDARAKDLRQAKHLGWLQVKFIPSKVHTEGILLRPISTHSKSAL